MSSASSEVTSFSYGYQFEDDVYNDVLAYTGAPFSSRTSRRSARQRARPRTAEYSYASTKTAPGTPIVLKVDRAIYSSPTVPPIPAITPALSRIPGPSAGSRSSPACDSSSSDADGNQQAMTSRITGRRASASISIRSTIAKRRSFASWGRFFEKIPLDIAVREFSLQTQTNGELVCRPRRG